MLGIKSYILSIVLFLQFVLATSNVGTVYLSSGDSNAEIAELNQLVTDASVEQPLVIFQFSKFSLFTNYASSDERVPYLTKFFKHDRTQTFQDDIKELNLGGKSVKTFKLVNLPESAAVLLYDYPVGDKEVIVFQLQGSAYELPRLDEFLDSTMIFLEESISADNSVAFITSEADILINSKSTRVNANEIVNSHVQKKKKSDKKKDGDKKDDEDEDILSTIWTEGLIMCLIVSALLLVILLVAINWIASLEISYGALEKSTNPLKKTN